MVRGESTPIDVIRLTHEDGVVHFINTMGTGFVAQAGELTNHRFKFLGSAGYIAAVLVCVARLRYEENTLRYAGTTDGIGMNTVTPHFKQGIELETHFEYPFYGWFMKARGTIPVPKDRQGALEALLRGVREEVNAGHSILGFPEGHRAVTGHVGRFHDGLFHIAIELGVPVAPVAVTGLYEVLPKGSFIIRPGNEVIVYVEEPIPTEGLTKQDVPALRDRVRDIISARVEARRS
jgi:1-acyl-sn-glycerol-3-phosphate acyltransferase